jgi:hypothetical protein
MQDLTVGQVEQILALQGYDVPPADLVEITARLNAQLKGLPCSTL